MLVRVIQDNPGTIYKSGDLVRISDKQAEFAIEQGFAVAADENEVYHPPTQPKLRKSDNPFMVPPRFIHSCGYVAKDEAQLSLHAKECK